ncbi:MAG: sugar phosphate isomerase/epimerase [Planctomycetaceae bacterium]|nr:sugar phosphate isomerase/epimerase [Planctomycetaceae bacterium]
MERRLFLKTATVSALGVVSFSSVSSVALAAAKKKRIPISVQVYSVRKAAEKDLAEALKKIAEIGYEGVEFAGYYGKDPKEVRKFLDDAGLKCSGTHTGIGALRGDNFEKTIELHKTLGTQFIIVPGGIDKELHSVEGNKKIAEEFNKLAEKAKAVGMVIGYHAHGGDAKLIDGIPAWERFFDATTPDVLMEMDLGNYRAGGGDPYKMIEKFKGRSKAVHLKESGDAIIGAGEIDWKRTFELCETIGGTQWYVVEDEKSADSFDRIEQCYAALKEMGKTKDANPNPENSRTGRRTRFNGLRRLIRG